MSFFSVSLIAGSRPGIKIGLRDNSEQSNFLCSQWET